MGLAAVEGAAVRVTRWLRLAVRWCGRRGGLLAFGGALAAGAQEAPPLELAVVVGAPGESQFGENFAAAARAWTGAARRVGAPVTVIGLESDPAGSDRDRLAQWLAGRHGDGPPLWLVYLGHGTFDGRAARLNLRGPDLDASELADALRPVTRPIVFVHGGSASAPFLPALSGPDRIILTATRSGHEVNYARFGETFAEVIADPSADIDQDGQTSLLEAFVFAAQRVETFYTEQGRLATEHALLDDNGDGRGTPAAWFRGTRLERRPEAGQVPDGERARLIALVPMPDEQRLSPEQRAQRDALEEELAQLRARKSTTPPDAYDRELERILRQLGGLYRAAGPAASATPGDS